MVNSDYLPSLGITMKDGINFTGNYVSDTLSVIINEAAAKLFAGKDTLNSIITASVPLYENSTFKVIGIMNDFHFESFSNTIEPLFYFCIPFEDFAGAITINFQSGNLENIEKDLIPLWKNNGILTPLEIETLPSAYLETYKEQNHLASVSKSFTMVTLFLVLFGLFAYLKYNIQLKTKELVIRKILGARSIDIYYSLNKEILILLFISIVISVPVGLYISTRWLSQFAYHISIDFESFMIPILLTLTVIILIGIYELYAVLIQKTTDVLKDD
jgi:putative ABC transport system permease protein